MKENWVFPCNIQYFDIIEHFRTHDMVIWKKNYSVKIDDIVYIYVSVPCREIKYKCHVIQDNVSNDTLEKNAYVVKISNRNKKCNYIQLKLDYEYPVGTITYEIMSLKGISRIQNQRRVERKLLNILSDANNKLNVEEA